MRRQVLTYGAAVTAAAGLIYAAAQAGQVQGHEGHQHGQTPPAADQPGHPNMPGMAAKGDGMGHMGSMGQMGMMGHMGMMEMMGGPLAALDRPLVRSLFGAFILPELQQELGLTAEQVGQLKQTKADLEVAGAGFSRKIAAKETELDRLFAPDTSKGQQVKALLEQIAELRAQQHYAIYTAARKMKAALTDEQRTRLEAMKPEELRHAAMAHLTMEDFARATALLRFAL